MRNTFILSSALIPSPDTEFLLEIFLSIKFFFFLHCFLAHILSNGKCATTLFYVPLYIMCLYFLTAFTIFAVVLILSNVECDLM